MEKSNYQVEVSPETCKACALCVKRCPMDAIQLKFSPKATNKFRKAVEIDTDLCIGCGVCVHKCKPNALTLVRKEETTRPPKTVRDMVQINAMSALSKKEAQAK